MPTIAVQFQGGCRGSIPEIDMIVEVELKLEIRLQGRFHRVENLVTLDRLPENTTPAPSVGEPGWLPILLGCSCRARRSRPTLRLQSARQVVRGVPTRIKVGRSLPARAVPGGHGPPCDYKAQGRWSAASRRGSESVGNSLLVPRRERAGARDQADRSDNTASRACRFEVSAEHHRRNRLFLAEFHNSFLPKQLHPFSRNR